MVVSSEKALNGSLTVHCNDPSLPIFTGVFTTPFSFMACILLVVVPLTDMTLGLTVAGLNTLKTLKGGYDAILTNCKVATIHCI